jgi:hypothetical protein
VSQGSDFNQNQRDPDILSKVAVEGNLFSIPYLAGKPLAKGPDLDDVDVGSRLRT